jgi:hypothetical protein
MERVVPNPEQQPNSRRSTDPRRGQILRQLIGLGVGGSVAEQLLQRFPLERIQQQLDWLPHRKARKPASMIVAAITENYDMPAAFYQAGADDKNNELAEPF